MMGLAIACGCERTSRQEMESPAPMKRLTAAEAVALSTANNQFAVDLWHRVDAAPGNLAISPASITTALAMVWGGARGDTAAQMRAVLHFDADAGEIASRWGRLSQALQDPDRQIAVRIANRLFGEAGYPFERAFLDDTRSAFGAAFEPVAFSSKPDAVRARINDWVEQRTEHRIKDLLAPGVVTQDTRLVLVNAIYFLADWANPFRKDATVDRDFVVGASRKRVKMMRSVASYRYAKSDGVTVLELPYKGNGTSMLVLLPDRADGLADLERTLDASRLTAWTAALTPGEVNVSLPRFTIDSAPLALAEHLAALGMPAAFDPRKADFTGIAAPSNADERLSISSVVHKAFVRVDEQGTEAAAATAALIGTTSARPAPIPFTADHPFLFAIVDSESSLVLFLGRVTDPS